MKDRKYVRWYWLHKQGIQKCSGLNTQTHTHKPTYTAVYLTDISAS